eukprot:m.340983 g.340983  ORF g.340983 m.340983 type:complete len:110 (-) comp19681_c0_seq1:227-556(-)
MSSVTDHFKVQSTAKSHLKKNLSSASKGSNLKGSNLKTVEKKPLPDYVGEVLRNFDLSPEFGPSVGVGRLERWERAVDLGLNPPYVVRELVEANPDDVRYTESIWHDRV